MDNTRFFTESISELIQRVLEERGIGLPVWGQVLDPETPCERIEVRCDAVEEVIPGNYTVRVDCSVVLLLDAARPAAEAAALAARVSECARSVLERDWHNKPLPAPEAEVDEEYEAEPFIVLGLVAAVENVAPEGNEFAWRIDFRAYVQF